MTKRMQSNENAHRAWLLLFNFSAAHWRVQLFVDVWAEIKCDPFNVGLHSFESGERQHKRWVFSCKLQRKSLCKDVKELCNDKPSCFFVKNFILVHPFSMGFCFLCKFRRSKFLISWKCAFVDCNKWSRMQMFLKEKFCSKELLF